MLKAKPIELIDVTKRFDRGIVAVTNFNLSVPGGEFVTLLGPSGCGKTTLLRMIAGLERPSSGRILINNEDVTDVPPNLRDSSIMFQDYALFPHKTVFENIGFGLKLRGLNRRTRMPRIQALLDLVHLPDIGDRKPSQLSGGQKQRVALARSLVIEPAVLLLDEPLGALDANLRGRMQVELKRVQRKVGITFFYVTHDQEEALTMSDRIVLMREGRIEQIGSPSDIYHRPRTEFVATFIGQCNILPAVVTEVSQDSVACQHDVFGRIVACNPFSVAVTPGHSVKLAIRPERLVLGGNGHGMENGGQVRLRDQIFMGSTRRSIVESVAGQELTVEGQSAGESWSDCESLRIAWLARDTLILASE